MSDPPSELPVGYLILACVPLLAAVVIALPIYVVGNQDLYDAIRQGDTTQVYALLDRGADPNSMSRGLQWIRDHRREGRGFRDPPLIVAIETGRADIIRALLDKGADPNARAQSGNTALSQAASSDQPDIVTLLLEHGAQTNRISRYNGAEAR